MLNKPTQKKITLKYLGKISLGAIMSLSIANASPLLSDSFKNSPTLNLNQILTHIDFKKLKPLSRFEKINKYYLTFYSGKTDNLKATYTKGMYALSYTQNW